MITRPRMHTSQTDAPAVPSPLRAGPASYTEWLQTLKRDDMVRVRTHMNVTMPPAMVTDATPCYVFVGKLKFHRHNGWQVAQQYKRCYRMKLRLVRDEKEFT
jgi:hypothetical protein